MLTFRKRVRSASTVISVFSEWPESLGPPALLRRKLYLDCAYRRQGKERRMERKTFPFSVSIHLFIALSIHLSSRRDALTPWRSLNSFAEASSDVRRLARTQIKARLFIVPQHGVVKRVCPRGPFCSCRFSTRSARLADARDCKRNGNIACVTFLDTFRCLPQKIRTYRDIDAIIKVKKFNDDKLILELSKQSGLIV